MTTTRLDLCRSVSTRLGIPLTDCRGVLEAMLDAWTHRLQEGQSLDLRGWGTLFPTTRCARDNARNPRTGAPAHVPRRRIVRFRAHRSLREGLR
jgi:nucleoid DNA-binding protein